MDPNLVNDVCCLLGILRSSEFVLCVFRFLTGPNVSLLHEDNYVTDKLQNVRIA
jgi:hypothetical protein